MACNRSYTLVKVELITGKSHQIRAQLKHLGYPLIGDRKYGDKMINRYFADRYGLKISFSYVASMCLEILKMNCHTCPAKPSRQISRIIITGSVRIYSNGNLEFQRLTRFYLGGAY